MSLKSESFHFPNHTVLWKWKFLSSSLVKVNFTLRPRKSCDGTCISPRPRPRCTQGWCRPSSIENGCGKCFLCKSTWFSMVFHFLPEAFAATFYYFLLLFLPWTFCLVPLARHTLETSIHTFYRAVVFYFVNQSPEQSGKELFLQSTFSQAGWWILRREK